MPVVPEPAWLSMPRIETSWRSSLKVTPGVYFAMSAKDLMLRICILAAVKALTLSGTLAKVCDWRVAVTTTSPTLVGPAAASAAQVGAESSTGARATVANKGARQPKALAIAMFPNPRITPTFLPHPPGVKRL